MKTAKELVKAAFPNPIMIVRCPLQSDHYVRLGQLGRRQRKKSMAEMAAMAIKFALTNEGEFLAFVEKNTE